MASNSLRIIHELASTGVAQFIRFHFELFKDE